ncbi:MAG: c-type cytochrome [Chloroflexi bacterium]|nr:c-type cytochrome [Chloroflexota bacterium]
MVQGKMALRRLLIAGGAGLLLALAGCQAFVGAFISAQEVSMDAPALVGDPAQGETIFKVGASDAPPCVGCHALAPGAWSLAPVMEGIHERAVQRVDSLSAEAYLTQSIMEPGAYLVPGFRDVMYPQYGERLSPQQIADLVAYLMTL